MADRPWVMPQEVKEYSDYKAVQDRADAKLAVDITRAEQYVISYTNNTFESVEKIPAEVHTAVTLIAEAYAFNAGNAIQAGTYKSETHDDYSYTVADSQHIDVDMLGIAPLLDGFVIAEPRSGVTMRIRKL